jgi:hypothetical protein
MISKQLFCKILKLIKEQDEIDDNFSKALETLCDSYCIYGTKNKKYEALFIILKDLFNDKGDWISWWLYEDVEKNIYIDSLKGKKKILIKTPEALYDLLIKNMKENE